MLRKMGLAKITATLVFFGLFFVQAVFAAPPVKPLWKSGKYYGGYPTIDKYLTQGVTFRISPDKVTLKDLSMEFPAEFHDENGVVTPRSIHFSGSEIEPITLTRTSRTQRIYFAYLDAFGDNWNTELRITWSRERQSFRIVINTQSDTVENTYNKASAILTTGAVRRSSAR